VGRHSAAEDEGSDLLGLLDSHLLEDAGEGQLLLAHGRHAAPDTEIVDTATPDGVAAPGACTQAAAQSAATPSPAKRRQGGTRADIQLMRRNPEVLARCIAGLVVPFVLYTVLLVLIGGTGRYLIWIWVPAIFAGVLMGAFLDAAHKRDRG
jgi:hypothetical protein